LNLDYDFFAPAQEAAPELTVEESRQRQVNSLVLQVFRLLVDLRKALDQRAYAQGSWSTWRPSWPPRNRCPTTMTCSCAGS